MQEIVLLPDTTVNSSWTSNFQGSDGTVLSSTPTVGSGAPSPYIDEGVAMPNDTEFICNISPGSDPLPFSGSIGFEQLDFLVSGAYVRIRIRESTSAQSLNLNVFVNYDTIGTLPLGSGSLSTELSSSYIDYLLPITLVNSGTPGNTIQPSIFLDGLGEVADLEVSGLRISELDLILSGDVPPATPFNAAFPLFTAGYDTFAGVTPLYIEGIESASGDATLYIKGFEDIDSSITLYLRDIVNVSGETPLFIGGLITSDNNHPLFIHGISQESASLNLFTKGREPIYASGEATLYIKGNNDPQSSKSIPLFIGDDAYSRSMNLFIAGQVDPTNADLNLVLEAKKIVYDYFPLYINNEYSGVNNDITLFIPTPEGEEGVIPIKERMNLFMSRNADKLAWGTSMFIQGPRQETDFIPMFIEGGYSGVDNSVTLAVSGHGTQDGSLKLKIGGF